MRTRILAAITAAALLGAVPAADAGTRLTFKQARKAVRAYQAKQKLTYDLQYDNQRCKRVRARRIDCKYRARTHGAGGNSAWCQYKGIVRKSKRTRRITVTQREAFATTPWCNS